MKKIVNKKVFTYLFIILVSLSLFTFLSGSVKAEINPTTAQGFETVISRFNQEATRILVDSAFSGLAGILGAIALIIYFALAFGFSTFSGSVFPSTDNIIFNKMAILDVNFINPNEWALLGNHYWGDKGNLLGQIYNSFTVIALAIFAIAAMIVGIKLAMASLASDKAAAKNSIKHWLMGIIILLTLRVVIAGIFELNEWIVWQVSKVSNLVEFDVYMNKGSILFGAPLVNVVSEWLGRFTATKFTITGFTGLLAYHAYQAAFGNVVSAILFFVLIGQTITLLITYIKRLTHVILIGVCGPLVVVFDTINKIMKGSSNLLNSWLKDFATTVFMQSFHSILLVVILNIIAGFTRSAQKSGIMAIGTLVSVITIILCSGLIKFEKMYKKMFGIEDGLGGLQESAHKMMGGLHAAKTGIKAIADNGAKVKSALKERNNLKENRSKLIKERGRIHGESVWNNMALAAQLENDPEKRREILENARTSMQSAIRDEYDVSRRQLDEFNRIADALEGNSSKNNSYVDGQTMRDKRSAASVTNSGYNYTAGASDLIDAYETRSTSNSGATRGTINNNYSTSSSNTSTSTNTSSRVSHHGSNINTSNLNSQGGNVNTNNINAHSITGRDGTVGEKLRTEGSTSNETVNSNKELQKELTQLRREVSGSNKTSSALESKNQEIAKVEKDLKKANGDLISSVLATAASPISIAAGAGIGIGAGRSLSESLQGGYVTAGIDAIAEKTGRMIGQRVSDAVVEKTASAVNSAINKGFDKHSRTDDTY